MLHSYDITLAAKMAQASYQGCNNRALQPSIRYALDEDDVQAYFLKGNILLIPGSNALADYIKYNLRVLNIGGTKYKLDDQTIDFIIQIIFFVSPFLNNRKGFSKV